MESNKLIKRINYVSVLLTILLILLAIFHFHSEMHFIYKGVILISCVGLFVFTFFFMLKKDSYGISDYFLSLLAQSFLFMLCVFGAKQGAYKGDF